jgi:hypothetical protein
MKFIFPFSSCCMLTDRHGEPNRRIFTTYSYGHAKIKFLVTQEVSLSVKFVWFVSVLQTITYPDIVRAYVSIRIKIPASYCSRFSLFILEWGNGFHLPTVCNRSREGYLKIRYREIGSHIILLKKKKFPYSSVEACSQSINQSLCMYSLNVTCYYLFFVYNTELQKTALNEKGKFFVHSKNNSKKSSHFFL